MLVFYLILARMKSVLNTSGIQQELLSKDYETMSVYSRTASWRLKLRDVVYTKDYQQVMKKLLDPNERPESFDDEKKVAQNFSDLIRLSQFCSKFFFDVTSTIGCSVVVVVNQRFMLFV